MGFPQILENIYVHIKQGMYQAESQQEIDCTLKLG